MLKYSFVSEPGGRSVNEDSCNMLEKGNKCCFVVCDGLGGHGMGDAASSLVTKSIIDSFEKSADVKRFLPSAFEKAQRELLGRQIELNVRKKMKTTCVALATDGRKAYIGYIGDSRLYVFYKNKVSYRTLDHSLPQMLVFSGEITEDEIRNHPERNIVLRVMGTDWEDGYKYDLTKAMPLRRCQAFLLCTDGFWELITEQEMCSTLEISTSSAEWLIRMNNIVRRNGLPKKERMDNYTAIAIFNS